MKCDVTRTRLLRKWLKRGICGMKCTDLTKDTKNNNVNYFFVFVFVCNKNIRKELEENSNKI